MTRKALSLLVVLLSLFVCASCSAQEATYPITWSELMRLSNNYQTLKQINLDNQNELAILQEQLTKSQEKLLKAESELKTLQEENERLLQSSKNVNKSFQQYKQEAQSRERKYERNNILYGIGGLLIGYACK